MGNVFSCAALRLAVLCVALALSSAAGAARLGHPDPFSAQPLQPGQPQQPYVNRNPLPDITFGARPPVVEPPLPANRVPPSIYYDNPYYQPPPEPAWRPYDGQARREQERRAYEWRERRRREQSGSWGGAGW